MLATKAVVHIADVAATQAYEQRVLETVAAVVLKMRDETRLEVARI
jgi:hypothetical protein